MGDRPSTGVDRYYGLYEAIVTKNVDPEQLKRVKVRFTEIGGNLESAWAPILSPMSGDGAGLVFIPEVDSYVTIQFMAGDVNRPVVTGGLWKTPAHKSQIPVAATKADPAFKGARGQDTTTTALGGTIQEPADQRAPTYPSNKVICTEQHLIELDDTPGQERISITHKQGKSYIDIYQDGSMVVGLGKGIYLVTGGDAAEHIKGKKDTVIDGNFTLKTLDQKHQGKNRSAQFQTDLLRALSVLWEIGGSIELKGMPIKLTGGLIQLGGAAPAPVVTTLTHPIDYITGIPILGTPVVQAG